MAGEKTLELTLTVLLQRNHPGEPFVTPRIARLLRAYADASEADMAQMWDDAKKRPTDAAGRTVDDDGYEIHVDGGVLILKSTERNDKEIIPPATAKTGDQ